jgi:DNA polymerase-3 subunit gamma/tau
MSRLTFYRKYRSQHFSELVGQEHIVQTLTNAITNNRLSHAYIFSGPRGTGKTSVARIFAKAVNTFATENQCETLDNEICQRITSGVCVDIVEIDAASNTGVDNIRDLNDKVNFAPVECAYKFYIIDEVHMLSTGAFNALLKTLEEPPQHTIFVLATTEPHKIPITIHSRCQHLRFRNLTEQEVKQQLLHVAEKETLTLADDAAAILARNSAGCMRDGLSLLDQMYSFTGDTITSDDVITILGSCSLDRLCDLVLALFSQEPEEALTILTQILKSGINPLQLLKDLMFLTEQVLMVISKNDAFITLQQEHIKRLTEQATLDKTIALLDCLAHIESQTRWFLNPGLLLQIRLINFMNQESTSNTTASPLVSNQNSVSQEVPPQPISPPASQPKTQPAPPPSSKPAKMQFNIPQPATPEPSKPPASEPAQSQPASTVNESTGGMMNHAPQAQETKPPVGELSLTSIQNHWPQFLETVKQAHLGLFTILRSSKVVGFQNNEISITLEQNIQFFIEKLAEETYQSAIKGYLNDVFNASLTLNVGDMKAQAMEMVSAVSDAVKLTNTQEEQTPQPVRMPKRDEEKPINDIVSLFEGTVL